MSVPYDDHTNHKQDDCSRFHQHPEYVAEINRRVQIMEIITDIYEPLEIPLNKYFENERNRHERRNNDE